MSGKHIAWAFVAFFLMLGLGGYAATFSPSYQYCKAPHTDDTRYQKQAYTDQFIPKSGGTFIDCEAFFADENGSSITAISTVFLTLVTGLLAFLAFVQFTATRTQLSAFVFVEDFRQFYEINPATIQPENEPRLVHGWAFRPIARNSGETQTRDLTNHVDYEYRESPLPNGFGFQDTHGVTTKSLIGPKAVTTGGTPRTFTVAEIQRVKDGERYLYMWGWMRYGDIFVTGKRHLTRYCIQVIVIGDPARETCGFQWIIPNIGNCCDDECAAVGLG